MAKLESAAYKSDACMAYLPWPLQILCVGARSSSGRGDIAMSKAVCPAPLKQLRRDAKRLAQQESIPLHIAQNRIAAMRGFGNWSQLVRNATSLSVAGIGGAKTRTRYYLHGDQSELNPSQYYCMLCDTFEVASHSQGVHGTPSTLTRFVQTLVYWTDNRHAALSNYRRPDDAVNLFANEVQQRVDAQAERERSRSAFHRWFDAQTGRPDPVGDLARDSQRLKDFPVEAESLDVLEAYLNRKGAAEEAVLALREAYAEYASPDRRTKAEDEEPFLGAGSLWKLTQKTEAEWEHYKATGAWQT
jgi:hypothetical protein